MTMTEPDQRAQDVFQVLRTLGWSSVARQDRMATKLADLIAAAREQGRREGAERALRVEPVWNEGNRNDGTYEYVETGDCHGGHLAWHRHMPPLAGPATKWEPATQEAYEAARYPEQQRADAIARGDR